MATNNAQSKPAAAAEGAIASLLKSAKYSDLELKCNEATFKVHQAILCPRSPVLAAVCDGKFQEALTKEIQVNDTDIDTLKRMLIFLYTDDYDDTDIDSSFFVESGNCSKVCLNEAQPQGAV